MVLPLLLLLAFGTLFFAVWTETNLSYAQLLQPGTKDALITPNTRSNLSIPNDTCKEDDNFPCKITECGRKHMNNWLTLFLLYLYMETDRTKFTNILIKCS